MSLPFSDDELQHLIERANQGDKTAREALFTHASNRLLALIRKKLVNELYEP